MEDERPGSRPRGAAGILRRVAAWAAERPVPVLGIVACLALAGGIAATRLEASTGADTLLPRSAPESRATSAYHRDFGGDPILVLVRGYLPNLLLTGDLRRLIGLEGCLAGRAANGATFAGGPSGPCARLARTRDVRVVYGPGTFLSEAVSQIGSELRNEIARAGASVRQARAAARREAAREGLPPAEQQARARVAGAAAQEAAAARLANLAVQSGLDRIPSLDDPAFIAQVVFDPARGYDVPKARFAYLFPGRSAALVQVRLRPGLSDSERGRAIRLVREATAMPQFRPRRGGRYVVTGAPVLLDSLAHSLTSSLAGLLVAALVLMAAALALVFRTRLRLLPLAIALATGGLTFGAMAAVGAPLTVAAVAVLPVLIGLAVDYAVQFQSRVREAEAAGVPRGLAVARGAGAGGPAIAAAGLATVAGFLALVLSPVPMVRGFGALLVAGVLIAFACTLLAGSAALALPGARGRAARAGSWGRSAAAAADGAARGAGAWLAAVPGVRSLPLAARGAVRGALRRPGRTVAIAIAIAAAGWALDWNTPVDSDITRLAPGDLPALRDVRTLQHDTGVAGEVDVVVRGRDLARPDVVRWMARYQRDLLRHFGYAEARGCGAATLCPALSLPDLFRARGVASSRAAIDALLAAVPPYFSQAVITPDRRAATMAFGIRLMPLSDQQRVIDEMRSRLRPPPGVRVELAGLPVVAAAANERVAAPGRRALMWIAALGAVAALLLLLFRRPRRALVPLVPIALATGWSALVLWAVRIPLNPMSAVLGALVLAISTEFSVLLSERYRAERGAGRRPREALRRTYRSTGAAVVVSATTVIAGFGVLVLSDIRMLREFGVVTVVDLAVSLAGVLIVLPAVLALAEPGALRERLRGRRRGTGAPASGEAPAG